MMNKLPINSSTCTNHLEYDQKQRSNQVQSPIIMSIAIQSIIHWSIGSQNLDKQYNRQKYRSNQVQFPLSPVCTVHHVYHCIGVGIVAPPVRSYTSLSSEVPYLELEVFVSHCLHIKPNGRYSGDDFTSLKSIQDCGFTWTDMENHRQASNALLKYLSYQLRPAPG